MSITAEIVALNRRIEDLEQAIEVARNESTGRAPALHAEMVAVAQRIEALRPFAEQEAVSKVRMPPCDNCGRPFWPENLTDGRCEFCGPLGGEGPSESIQTGDLKRRRAPKS